MNRWLWLLLLAVWVPHVWAMDLTLDDFAYGIRIDVPDGTAVAAMSLPKQVYINTFRPDLGDLRVFNAGGEPVPHMIRYATTQSTEAPWRSLAFFPLPAEVMPEASGYHVFVRTGPDGALIRVDPAHAQPPVEPARTFLIDLSHIRRPLTQMRFEWQSRNLNRLVMFAVDASDDLVAWTTIQPRAAISDIRYGGHRLRGNTISLVHSAKRYLRLRQLDTGPAVALTRIEGRIRPEGRASIRAYLKIDGLPEPDSPGVYHYQAAGTFPVDRINLIFGQANSMADAMVESRNDSKSTWVRRYKGLFYRIDVDATPLTSAPQVIPMAVDRHWRLTVDASDSTLGSAVPRLEIGYRPHDLFFVARGSGPYMLTFGSATVEPLKVNVAALFDGISQHRQNGIEQWVMPPGQPIVLGGPQRLSPLPKPLPIRRIVLWSILVAGVFVVAVMAWRLAYRMKRG